MHEGLELDCAAEEARITAFIVSRLAASGCSQLVLGLSGGVDSALVAALCANAVGASRVHALLLPYQTSNPSSEADAMRMVRLLDLPYERLDITPMVRPLLESAPTMDSRRLGNIMARSRMIVLFDRSAAHNALVVGTSNRTETLLGYFTIHGDGAAAFKPIAHLYKSQVRALSRHVGVPDDIIDKPPSADLWEGQTDEGELGFTYDEADQVLYLLTERGPAQEQICAQGFSPAVVAAIARRMASTAFKRSLPPDLSQHSLQGA
jgi:NAD+ synthase